MINIFEVKDACRFLNSFGWNLEPNGVKNIETLGEDVIYFETTDDNTAWEFNIADRTTRHKGLERGCFWTEWEHMLDPLRA